MICDEAVSTEPLSLAYVPDRFKTQKNVQGGSAKQTMHTVICP